MNTPTIKKVTKRTYCWRGGENGYCLMKDKTQSYVRKWDFLTADGHPSYSPECNYVVTDTYPKRKRISMIRILSEVANTVVALDIIIRAAISTHAGAGMERRFVLMDALEERERYIQWM